MWDLAPMSINYKPPTLYVGYSSFQYGTGVSQSLPLKPLTSSSMSCGTVSTAWHYNLALIPFITIQEKVLAISTLSPQKDQLIWSFSIITYKPQFHQIRKQCRTLHPWASLITTLSMWATHLPNMVLGCHIITHKKWEGRRILKFKWNVCMFVYICMCIATKRKGKNTFPSYKIGTNLWKILCSTLSRISFSLSNTVSKWDAATWKWSKAINHKCITKWK